MLERYYQAKLIKKIKMIFPGAVVLKNDGSNVPQGIPDLTILFKDKWAMLEVKNDKDAPHQPNQDIRVEQFNRMSYANFIYPQNESEVLHDLQRTFELDR